MVTITMCYLMSIAHSTNPTYAGFQSSRTDDELIEGTWEPIMSLSTFQKVQENLQLWRK